MRAIWITAAMGLAVAGCKGKAKSEEKAGRQPGAPVAAGDAALPTDAGAAGVAPDAATAAAQAPAPAKLEGAARADLDTFVTRWLAAQNDGDFAAYQTFYGDRFHGVRRSGKQVRRFDRAGWMKDRGGMFKRPMEVQATDVVAYAQGDKRQVFFTQTWAQGSYKDTGTKAMIVTGKDDAIRIVYEELLASKLEAPAAASALADIKDTVFGFDRAASVDTMRLARVDGGVVLLGFTPREVAWVDPIVVDRNPDPITGLFGSGVVEGEVPAGDPLAALAGVTVTVLDEDLEPACTGKLGPPEVRFAGYLHDLDDEDDAITKARAAHDFTVIAKLAAPCTGPFVRGVKAAAITPPAATDELPERTLKGLHTWNEGTQEGDWDSAAAGKSGWVLVVVHTNDSCESEEAYTWTLHRATQAGKSWKLEAVEDGDGEDSGLRVLDIDGDGALDALTRRGAYVGGTWQDWDPDLRLYWPAGLGCDGYDPDEETVGD